MSEVNKLSPNEFRSDCLPVHVRLPCPPAVARIESRARESQSQWQTTVFRHFVRQAGRGGAAMTEAEAAKLMKENL